MRCVVLGLLAVGVLLQGCGGEKPDCGQPPDLAGWREATAPTARLSERYEGKRREVAEHLVSCGSLRGVSRVEVLRQLGSTGSGLPDARTRADGRHAWLYYLGPDSQLLDDENLSVTFDDRDRAVQFRVTQG
jgi:hypothetical protein